MLGTQRHRDLVSCDLLPPKLMLQLSLHLETLRGRAGGWLLHVIRAPAHEWIHPLMPRVDLCREAASKAMLAWSLKDPVSGHVMPYPSWALCQQEDHCQLCSSTWERIVISNRKHQDRGLYKCLVKTNAYVFVVHSSSVGCEQGFC